MSRHRARVLGLALPLLLNAMPVPSTAEEAKPGVASRRARDRAEPASASRLGHTVRHGDSLWTIARRYGVTPEALARANRLEPGQRLRLGRHLRVPTVAAPGNQEPASLAEIVRARPPVTPAAVFAWPVVAPVGSPFGPRLRGWHGGIDLQAERGTPIRAAAPGMVIMSGWEGGYGRVVKIWHHADLMTVYAHNQENYVRVGDWIERGEILGTVGSTGRASAPHLRFEIRLDGKKYDPLFWLPPAEQTTVAAVSRAGVP